MTVKEFPQLSKSLFIVAVIGAALLGLIVVWIISQIKPTNTQKDPVTISEQAEEETEDGEQRVTGVVTELFRDCAERLLLQNGEVVSSDAVSCDGGSYLVVDSGEPIFYASGYVPADQSYWYDVGDLMPGDTVEVIYEVNEFGGSDLNCDACSVRVLE